MARWKRFRVACACFCVPIMLAGSGDIDLRAQSGGASLFALEVASAVYNPQTDHVTITLRNTSSKAVTAYGLDISLLREDNVVWNSAFAEDLLNDVIDNQCRLLPNNNWVGAIEPGASYVVSRILSVDKSELIGSTPTVRAVVTGAILTDGTIQGNHSSTWLHSVDQFSDRRVTDAGNEARVLSIFAAHQDDPDIHTRLAAIIQDIQSLAGGDSAKTVSFSTFVINLQIGEKAPDPKAFLDVYSGVVACDYHHREAMLRAAPVNTADN